MADFAQGKSLDDILGDFIDAEYEGEYANQAEMVEDALETLYWNVPTKTLFRLLSEIDEDDLDELFRTKDPTNSEEGVRQILLTYVERELTR